MNSSNRNYYNADIGRRRLLVLAVFWIAIGTTLGCRENTMRFSGVPESPHFNLVDPYEGERHGALNPAIYHAQALVNGDYRPSTLRVDDMPYHLQILLSLGQDAAPYLVQMLKCSNLTPIHIRGGIVNFAGGLVVNNPMDRQATVADLAEYGLRSIYTSDTIFHPYPMIDSIRIQFWEKIVSEDAEQRGIRS